MVGGTIEDIHIIDEKRWALLVRGTGVERMDCCGVNIDPLIYTLKKGDSVWWQDNRFYWTPDASSRREVFLFKLGFSYTKQQFDLQKEQAKNATGTK